MGVDELYEFSKLVNVKLEAFSEVKISWWGPIGGNVGELHRWNGGRSKHAQPSLV